ncbi:MAG: ABC transporter permease [Micropruina sp.]|uniref:ABC transporter permease n=1 Tax=Micropruina sp. TaxID=2737536 RepID=UPI0039E3C64A
MSLADYAAQHGLHRVGARPRLLSYLKQAWDRRDFPLAMARFRIQASQQRNRLGMLWLVLQPSLNALVYGVIFYWLQTGGNRPPDYPAYIVIGVFLFDFFSKSLSNGAKSITGNRALVQSLAFPRITLPIAVVLENFMALMPMLGVMALALVLLGHPPAWDWLLMVPLLALYTLFNCGVAMIAARLTVHVRDLTQILPFVNRILFYTSGVLFAVDRIFSSHPWVVQVYDFHPLYQVLQIARGLLMNAGHYSLHYWAYFALWSVLVFVVGLLFFWVAEERYGRD